MGACHRRAMIQMSWDGRRREGVVACTSRSIETESSGCNPFALYVNKESENIAAVRSMYRVCFCLQCSCECVRFWARRRRSRHQHSGDLRQDVQKKWSIFFSTMFCTETSYSCGGNNRNGSVLCISASSVNGTKQHWKVRAPNRCRFFLWLVLHGCCWTLERLQRHVLDNHGNCILYTQEV